MIELVDHRWSNEAEGVIKDFSTNVFDCCRLKNYERLHELVAHGSGRTQKSLTEEYVLDQGTISYWLKQHRKECQSNPHLKEQTDAFEENKRLRRELAEKEKEIAFLKKAAAFFAKEIK